MRERLVCDAVGFAQSRKHLSVVSLADMADCTDVEDPVVGNSFAEDTTPLLKHVLDEHEPRPVFSFDPEDLFPSELTSYRNAWPGIAFPTTSSCNVEVHLRLNSLSCAFL